MRLQQTVHCFILLVGIYILHSCKPKAAKQNKTIAKDSAIVKKPDTTAADTIPVKRVIGKDEVASNNWRWFSDHVFHRRDKLIKYYFTKYNADTKCPAEIRTKKEILEEYEGYKNLGDVNKDGKSDSVFVMRPFNVCEWENGQGYYFTDTSLPRLIPDSWCCHPSNVFMTADIDGDGICEVGYYYSVCVSRFKSLRLFSLKNKQWQCIAMSEFDILTQDPSKVKLENQVQRIAKNKFRMHNFYEGKIYWDTVLMK